MAGFYDKYMSPAESCDANAAYGFGAGDDHGAGAQSSAATTCRATTFCNRRPTSRILQLPMLLPGIKINTSPDNFNPIRQLQLAQFDGESWQLFGDIITG